jgi:hypothetical protein
MQELLVRHNALCRAKLSDANPPFIFGSNPTKREIQSFAPKA